MRSAAKIGLAFLGMVMGLLGCQMTGATPTKPADACGAAALQGLVGQPRSVLDTMRFSQPVRVIAPGSAVTMDYVPQRLNIVLNTAGKIAQVQCG